jgi:hypothetical protein
VQILRQRAGRTAFEEETMKRSICTLALAVFACCVSACDENNDPYCDGTPDPCAMACANDGCYGGWSCTGYSWECSSAYSEWDCENAGSYYGACSWTYSCNGGATPCDEFDSSGSCRAQQGCEWVD